MFGIFLQIHIIIVFPDFLVNKNIHTQVASNSQACFAQLDSAHQGQGAT